VKAENAEFWAAARNVAEIPRPRAPEIAVAGRSNVGKSTLINRLTGRKRLARTSATPGCTRGLIFYAIGERMVLVDLPGYGWARRSVAERAAWKPLVEGYLSKRRALAGVLVLADIRRGPQEEELQLAEYLDAHDIKRVWVMTKADKLSRQQVIFSVEQFKRELKKTWDELPMLFVSSAEKKNGRDEILDYIEQTNKEFKPVYK
jgi:GTP-binding protein